MSKKGEGMLGLNKVNEMMHTVVRIQFRYYFMQRHTIAPIWGTTNASQDVDQSKPAKDTFWLNHAVLNYNKKTKI